MTKFVGLEVPEELLTQPDALRRAYLRVLGQFNERFEELARIQVLEGKTWNHPVVANGVVYARNATEAVAYRFPERSRAE